MRNLDAAQSARTHEPSIPNASLRLLPTIRTPRDLAPLLHNDFDAPILQAIPALAELRTLLEQGGALRVILCGSGAAQAALCESEAHAKALAQMLLQQNYWAVWARSG
jgi:4-diphosphocytidyl-2C-methyl-D-erythritol kinase